MLSGVFQGDDCERLSIPTIEKGKHGKARHSGAENVRQIGSFKAGGMASKRIVQQLQHQLLHRPGKLCRYLPPSVNVSNAIAVMPDASVERWMNKKSNGHQL